MTEPRAALPGSFWTDEKSPGLLGKKWGHNEAIPSQQEGEFLGIHACQEESVFTFRVASSGKKTKNQKTLPVFPSPKLCVFCFWHHEAWVPWMPGQICIIPSWLYASPGCSFSRPRQLPVTHCLSLVPADSLPWTCLKLNCSLRTEIASSCHYLLHLAQTRYMASTQKIFVEWTKGMNEWMNGVFLYRFKYNSVGSPEKQNQ